ncbi:germination protein M [Bacillus sp. OV322]|uniref:GerMN domain-containing protein n=1 Tax=Bacillus sp. OV322 TaxID=1882764 RepID=UPI0008E3F476|nr:germination protein M [Bacillus sp. OV322]
MSKATKITVAASAILASSVLLSGCGLFGADEKIDIDPQKNVSLVDDASKIEKENNKKKEIAKETAGKNSVQTELYLIDKSGYVVPQTLTLPKKSEGFAKQALEYLVDNGPVSNIIPNGFRPVLPADTEVSVDIKDGVATADFSKEFKNYKKEDELKILQSITWTLTQFDTVKKVKISMNGQELKTMPVNGTPIGDGVSRMSGINLDTNNVTDISNTKALTVYYIGGETGNNYYVPVTKRVSETKKDDVAAVVDELVKGPSSSSLLTVFAPDVKLTETPEMNDGKVTLNFNKNILGSFKENKVSKDMLDALVLSLTEQQGINSVEVKVNGSAKLLNEDGKKLSEPVTRPEKVNTGSY